MIIPSKFRYIYPKFKRRPFTLLDVGAGNHSPSLTKKLFPDCIYHGVDIATYSNSENDMSLMDRYFEMDVTKLFLMKSRTIFMTLYC